MSEILQIVGKKIYASPIESRNRGGLDSFSVFERMIFADFMLWKV
jgi:hypothetical protein